jgi:hypothetical protein
MLNQPYFEIWINVNQNFTDTQRQFLCETMLVYKNSATQSVAEEKVKFNQSHIRS